ncbi:MAG: hypothetical protein ABI614_13400 [Planctomycetota bacterium]
MKGPFERLKYDLRRVWECPECHHKERADGTVTTVVCRCQATKEPHARFVMKLIEDRIQRRFPVFVPSAEVEEAAIAVALPEEIMPVEEPVADDSASE